MAEALFDDTIQTTSWPCCRHYGSTLENILISRCLFHGARPFSLFEESAMLDLHAALKLSYKIPCRKTIGGRILDECYSETFLEVLQAIHNSFSINISTDESSTSKDRVINYCIVTEKKESFCMKLELVEVGTSSAERQAAWLDESLDELVTRSVRTGCEASLYQQCCH